MKDIYNILKKPVITEKSNFMKEEMNQITFEVARQANKIEIKKAIEKLFKVHVIKVHIINILGKKKRLGKSQGKRPDRKKAIVTMKEGEQIDFFEGV